jgi:hypothetical protein
MVSGTKPATERRAHARVVHFAHAVLSTRRGEVVGDVFDVSVGGLGVTVEADIHPGEFVRVRLPLQPDTKSTPEPKAPVVAPRPRPPTRDDLQGLIRASMEHVADERRRDKAKKRK